MAPRKLGALALPPSDLAAQRLPILTYSATLVRIHALKEDPAFWGSTGRNRFDAPSGEFGVLYAAADPYGAFIETYGDTGTRVVTTTALSLCGWARVAPIRDLQLVDLSGPGLAQIGADERLCSGEHQQAQEWSRALWRHPATVDGLYYRARHDPSRMSAALFNRAASAVVVTKDGGLTENRHQRVLAEILDAYQFALL